MRYITSNIVLLELFLDVPCIGFIVPVYGSDNCFVIGAHTTLYIVKWDGFSSNVESLVPLHKLNSEPETNRINDGKCDPYRRLWFGKILEYIELTTVVPVIDSAQYI